MQIVPLSLLSIHKIFQSNIRHLFKAVQGKTGLPSFSIIPFFVIFGV